jgi:hypothetical protein
MFLLVERYLIYTQNTFSHTLSSSKAIYTKKWQRAFHFFFHFRQHEVYTHFSCTNGFCYKNGGEVKKLWQSTFKNCVTTARKKYYIENITTPVPLLRITIVRVTMNMLRGVRSHTRRKTRAMIHMNIHKLRDK